MQNPDTQSNFQQDFFGFDDEEIPILDPPQVSETNDSFSVRQKENPWFYDDELTPSEKLSAEIWAEQNNLYYYTL